MTKDFRNAETLRKLLHNAKVHHTNAIRCYDRVTNPRKPAPTMDDITRNRAPLEQLGLTLDLMKNFIEKTL